MTRPRVLFVDASPCWGGALTSLEALFPLLERAGLEPLLVSTHPDAVTAPLAERLVQRRPLGGDPRADHGVAWARREVRRAVELSTLAVRTGACALVGNNTPGANASAHFAARALGLPIAQYVRGQLAPSRLARWLLARTDASFAVGAELARAHPTTLEVTEGLSRAQWPSRTTGDEWLWCGSRLGWKGLPLAIEAHRLCGRARVLNVCHVGPRQLEDTLEPLVPAPRSSTHLHAWESLPADALDAVRARCSVLLHTSLTPEPFGRTVLEGMAAGLVPVVPDEGTPSRLIRHGESGLHYAARDASSLARALVALSADGALRARLTRGALAVAAKHTAEWAFAPVVARLATLCDGTVFHQRHTTCSTNEHLVQRAT